MPGDTVIDTLFAEAVRRGERVRCCVVTAPGGYGKTALAESLISGLAEHDIGSMLLTGDVASAELDLGDTSVVVVDAGDSAPGALLDRLRADVLSPDSPRSLMVFARSATGSPELAELAALADRDNRLGQVGPLSLADLAERIPTDSAVDAQSLHDLTGGIPAHVDRLCAGWDDEGWPTSPHIGSLPERFKRHSELLMSRLTPEARVALATLSITDSSALDRPKSNVVRALFDAGLIDQNGRVPDAIARSVDGVLDEAEKHRAIEDAGVELLRSDPAFAAEIVAHATTPPLWAAAALAAAGNFGEATRALNTGWVGSEGIVRAAAAHVAGAESRWSDAVEHATNVTDHPYWSDGQIAGVARMYQVLDGAVLGEAPHDALQEPMARFIDEAARLLSATIDPDGDLDEIGDQLRALARQSTNQQPMLDVAVSPAELGAIAALMAGEFEVAKALIDSSAEVNDRSPLHASLSAWVSVRAGHEPDGSAATAPSDSAEPASMVAARVLDLAARVMTTRRTSDAADQADVLGEISAAGAALSVDVLTFDALCELHLGAQRVDARLEAREIAAGVDGLIERLGAPHLWDVRRRWNQVESAVAGGDADALKTAADHLTALCALGHGVGVAAPLAAAAQQWVRVFAGQIDKRTLVECLDDLEARGYVWEAAALAGQAAIRTTNADMARELLQRGREYRQTVPEPMVTSPAGLSEREIEIGQHVLAGHSYKEIGAMCFISPKTVEHHIAHIRQKLAVVGVSRAEFRAALEADLRQS